MLGKREIEAVRADADPAGFQRSVYAQLGLSRTPDIALSTRTSVIGDEINAEWIERFREAERARGAA